MSALEHDSNKTGLAGINLCLSFGSSAVLDNASINVAPGQVTALAGANGSGKSTLLRSLARLHTPQSGEVQLGDGQSADLLSRNQFAQQVTLLSQSRPTPGGVTVRDVVAYGRNPHRRGWRTCDPEGDAAIEWAMDVTGVASMAHRSVDELSGGELQRVWLGTCLAQKTSVLLLDEPTTYLDLRYQVEILELIRALADDHGVAVGVVLHDLQQVADISDTVVLLNNGVVAAAGSPTEVLTPAHLSPAFGISIDVTADCISGRLRVEPIGKHLRRLSAHT